MRIRGLLTLHRRIERYWDVKIASQEKKVELSKKKLAEAQASLREAEQKKSL